MALFSERKLVTLAVISLLVSGLSLGLATLGGAETACAQGACSTVVQRFDVSVKPDSGWNTALSPYFVNNQGLTLPVKYPSNITGNWTRFEMPMPENVSVANSCTVRVLARFSSGSELVYPHTWVATRSGGQANTWELQNQGGTAVSIGTNMVEMLWYTVTSFTKDDTLFIAMQPTFGNSTDLSPNNHDFYFDDVWVECTINY